MTRYDQPLIGDHVKDIHSFDYDDMLFQNSLLLSLVNVLFQFLPKFDEYFLHIHYM